MEKSYLDKLHLSKNFPVNTAEIYSNHLFNLNKLKVIDLKKYFYIYHFIHDELLLYIYPVVKSSLFLNESLFNSLLSSNSTISDYFSGRFKETDLSRYIDLSIYNSWFRSISLDLYTNYSYDEKIDIYVKCCSFLCFIDYLLILRDEYWYRATRSLVKS